MKAPMRGRFAYADPPYEGQAKKHYGGGKGGDPFQGEAEEVDHAELIARLVAEFPDGWALSCKTNSLRTLLPLTPEGTRVLAWVKPWAFWGLRKWPAYAWEPVLLWTSRPYDRTRPTPRDWFMCNAGADNGKAGVPKSFSGAKPRAFCRWLFECFGMTPEDELVDLYPGTGAVQRAWETWRSQKRLPNLRGGGGSG